MELPWDTVVVTGVPGVGKTSLCKIVAEDLGYNYINYGDLMLSIAESKDLAYTDTEMFSLDMEIQYTIWKETALKIKNKKKVLVDLHGVDQSSIGYIVSLPIKIFEPDIILIIEASMDNILWRRSKDAKKRIIDSISSLDEHMHILKITMSSVSAIIGCNLKIVKNDDFNSCLEEMKRVLGGV